MPRARTASGAPAGLVYRPDLLEPAEEHELLARFDELDFQEIVMKGVVARRTAVRYRFLYDYGRRLPIPGADPIPPWLVPYRDRGAARAGLDGEELVQALVQRYPPGAPIGWHRDSPSFEVVVGISLGSAARLRLRRGPGEAREVYEQPLEPRSAYMLADDARWRWEHHVPPAKELRY